MGREESNWFQVAAFLSRMAAYAQRESLWTRACDLRILYLALIDRQIMETIDLFLSRPVALLIVLAIGSAIGIVFEKYFAGVETERKRAYWRGRNTSAGNKIRQRTGKIVKSTDLAADQLGTVMQANFSSRALLNKSEQRLLGIIESTLTDFDPSLRVMGQVSLGEILASKDRDAYFAINSKRVDLLIIDANCQPLHAIEFQGTGHHIGKNTAARDAVKKEALRRAGIGYVEVVSGDTPAQVRKTLERLIGKIAA